MHRYPLPITVILGVLFTIAVGACIALAKQDRVGEALLGAIVVLVGAALVMAIAVPHETRQDPSGIATIRDRVDELADTVREVAAHSALSADARRVLFRKQERDLLLQAIEEDIAERQWDAAAVLVTELESRLGYTVEAAAARTRISMLRADSTVAGAASEPVPKSGPAFTPAPPAVDTADVPEITVTAADSARQATRQELERRFMAAASEGREEAAMAILAELDQYVTTEEAEPLREIARGVIAKARDALGEQFKGAVQGKRWQEAVTVGEQIMQRFPNTRMASEVRDVMDALKARA